MSEDFGALAEKLKTLLDNGGADGLMGLLNKNENKDSSPDMETFFRLKQAFDKVNSSPDPRISLLSSLKPYMNGRRSMELDRISNL